MPFGALRANSPSSPAAAEHAARRHSTPRHSQAGLGVFSFPSLLSALREEYERLELRIRELAAENSRLQARAVEPCPAEAPKSPKTPGREPGKFRRLESPKLMQDLSAKFRRHDSPKLMRDVTSDGGRSQAPADDMDGTTVCNTSTRLPAEQAGAVEHLGVTGPGLHHMGTTGSLRLSELASRLPGRPSTRAEEMAVTHSRRRCRSTAARINKLHRWFVQIDRLGSGILTQRQLRNIYWRVRGPGTSIPPGLLERLMAELADEQVIQFVLDDDAIAECELHEAEVGFPGPTAVLRSETMQSPGSEYSETQEQALSFRSFVALIFWGGLGEKLSPDLKDLASALRDALVKHTADVFIAHYAHLQVYAPEDMQGAPVSLVALDSFSGLIIAANAMVMGLRMDSASTRPFELLELSFSIYYVFEFLCRIWHHGFKRYFSGLDLGWNLFDTIVVIMSVVDTGAFLYQESMSDAAGKKSFGPITLLGLARIANLTRLLRLVRVLRLRIFKELFLMAKGVVAGMRTLIWAIVLLMFTIYASAVLMRELVGDDGVLINDTYGTVLWSDMAWSMFMIFRILMNDTSLPDGTPVVGRMYELYGVGFMIPYMLCLLFAAFGMFNLITALFVENVLEAAKQKRRLSVVQERVRVAQALRELVFKFTGQRTIEEPQDLRHRMRRWWNKNPLSVYDAAAADPEVLLRPASDGIEIDGSITRQMFAEALCDPRVHKLLNDLEVQMADRNELFDVLDADHSGSVDVAELIEGLMKLRSGGSDKSDVVATVLGIRAISVQLRAMDEAVMGLLALASAERAAGPGPVGHDALRL